MLIAEYALISPQEPASRKARHLNRGLTATRPTRIVAHWAISAGSCPEYHPHHPHHHL